MLWRPIVVVACIAGPVLSQPIDHWARWNFMVDYIILHYCIIVYVIKNNKAFIEGSKKFEAAEVMSSDLRAAAALVLAGIASKGKTIINRIYHCLRGYENFELKLRKIGVKIKRVS